MLSGIVQLFGALPEGTRTVIIHGEGDHFCAGADFSSMLVIDAASGSTAARLRLSQLWHHAFAQIENIEVPVLAVLHGAVVGGGLELAAAAHIRIAERSVFYALPEASRGIFVGGGALMRIPRLIGVPRMSDMMLSGRVYGAEEGLAVRLSQYLVEPGEGLTKALEMATRIAVNPPLPSCKACPAWRARCGCGFVAGEPFGVLGGERWRSHEEAAGVSGQLCSSRRWRPQEHQRYSCAVASLGRLSREAIEMLLLLFGMFTFGIFGLIVGSFFNVVIIRGTGALIGRSACMSCGKTLAWYDMVPVVSWFLLRGRCRTCGSALSIQYPLVEGATAILFALVGLWVAWPG